MPVLQNFEQHNALKKYCMAVVASDTLAFFLKNKVFKEIENSVFSMSITEFFFTDVS